MLSDKINLNLLRIFEKVYETKSMTRASQELFMTQSGVSQNIKHLEEILEREVGDLKGIESLVAQLHDVNAHLWEIEDELRDLESVQNFGVRFIEMARQVYQFNDERYRLKRAISDHYGSMFVEEKSYS